MRARGATTLAVAILAVITLAATACSSSKKATTSTTAASTGSTAAASGSTAAPATTAAAATGTPVKIGFICSCTSPLGSSTAINLPGYQAWVKYTNDNGGLNGHPIDLIVKDDNGNPATSIADVHELVGTDHVIALSSVTNFEAGWASYVEQQKIPVIGGSTVTPEDYTASGWFSQGQTTDSDPAAEV
jgi:branched-chain amino acid transport system substrate-binding protein